MGKNCRGGVPLISEQEYQNELSTNGVCGKFSSGDGENTFRVPYIKGMELAATDTDKLLGDFQTDQMRPITGTVDHIISNASNLASSGAIEYTQLATASSGGNGIYSNRISLDSSLLGEQYNGSDTHSKRIFATPMLKMYSVLTESAQLNVDELISKKVLPKAYGFYSADVNLPGLLYSYNIATVTRFGVGQYKIHFLNPFSDHISLIPLVSCNGIGGTITFLNRTSISIDVHIMNSAPAYTDIYNWSIVIF